MVWRKGARLAIQDGEYAHLDGSLAQRRQREKARATHDRRERNGGTARIESDVLDHLDVQRQRELWSLRRVDSNVRFEPQPGAPEQTQNDGRYLADTCDVSDQLVQLRVRRRIGDRQSAGERNLFVFAGHRTHRLPTADRGAAHETS